MILGGRVCLGAQYSSRSTNLFSFGLPANVDSVYDISLDWSTYCGGLNREVGS